MDGSDALQAEAEADALQAKLFKLQGLVARLELDLGPPRDEAKTDTASISGSSTDSYVSFIAELLLRPSKVQSCSQSEVRLAKRPRHDQLTGQIETAGLQEIQQEIRGLKEMQQETGGQEAEEQENQETWASMPIESGQLSTLQSQPAADRCEEELALDPQGFATDHTRDVVQVVYNDERVSETQLDVTRRPLEKLDGQSQSQEQHAQQSDASLRPDERLLHTKRALVRSERQAAELQNQVQELQARAQSQQVELAEAASKNQDALDEAAQEAAERRRLASECRRLQDALEVERDEANHQVLTLRSRYQTEFQELRAELNSRDAEIQEFQFRQTSVEQAHEEDLRRTKAQLHAEQQALLQCQSELAEARAALQHDRFQNAQMRQENARLTADLKASDALTESLRAELIGTGERATDQHAKCCDLWVALEKERLEAQHLRELFEAAKRESAALTKQLQNQPRTEQKLPVQSAAYEPPTSPQQRCRSMQSIAHQPPSPPQQRCRPLHSVTLEPPSSPQQRCRPLQTFAQEPPLSPQQHCRPVQSAANELPASPKQRNRPLQGAAHDAPQSPQQHCRPCAGAQVLGTRATLPMRAHTERQHRSLLLEHLSGGVHSESAKIHSSVSTTAAREQKDSVGSILRHGFFSQEEEKRREHQTAALEKQLMVLNGERAFLKGSLLKYPSNFAGKTLAERRTKREAEQRLEDVERTISDLKNSLRRLSDP
eukprot:TRINITY_DN59814_c0_g1_i1.p1 TRINITY_DN59814_c0_g1~~TRINITY_DN59814_c0_g1_i1.p1  ORF type:complete len:720 (+),score=166.78 TRINITY_DN59814_c0_g1_i1:61-2220(+)